MNEWWAAKDLAGTPGMPGTERGVQFRSVKEAWTSRPRTGRGGGREYHLSSLPEETRMALLAAGAETERKGSRLDFAGNGSDKDQDSDPGTRQGQTPGSDSDPGSSVSPVADLQGWLESRHISLSPKQLADPRMQKKLSVSRAIDLCPAYQGREKLIAALAARHAVSPITIRRWHYDIETMQTKSTPRIKLGDTKVDLPESYAFTPQALAFGLSIFANNMHAGMRAAYRAIQSQAEARAWRVADYGTFTRIVKKIPEAVWIRLKKGATGFELECVPKIIRQWTAVPVQSVLCGDQKIFDYEVYDEEFSRIIIPNGYFWMDCASRMINGVWIEMGHYNAYTVGMSLREALHYGVPGEIFTDWGKPETSKHIASMRRALSAVSVTGDFMAMEDAYGMTDGIEHRKAQAGKPWVKPIENIMNILDKRLAEKFVGGYRKRNDNAWVNKVIQTNLKKDRKLAMAMVRPANRMEARGLMPVKEFISTVFAVVEEHNRAEKQLREGGTIIPFDFFLQGCLSRPPKVLADEVLSMLCMPHKDVIPRNSVVALRARSDDYRGYYSSALAGLKKKVRVFFDPYDPEAEAVITDIESGEFIDIAANGKWHCQNPYDREGISYKRARQAELMKWVEACANRVKEGFDLAIRELRDARQGPIEVIGPASVAAREAGEAKKIYHLRKENTKLLAKDTARQADALRHQLQASFAAQGSAPFSPPPEGKERYICWLDLAARKAAGESLSEEEADFLECYPRSPDYRNQRDFHEEFGEIYIRTKPLTLIQEVKDGTDGAGRIYHSAT